MPEQQTGYKKREIAYKMKIGDILQGTPIVEDIPSSVDSSSDQASQTPAGPTREKFRFLELGDKKIIRVNIIANVIDKYSSEGEKRFATITIDDASGQIRLKVFGDDVSKFENISQGDTIIVIGVLRSYNQELYILPDILKKTDPKYLLVRKLEIDKESYKPQSQVRTDSSFNTRDKIIEIIKSSEQEGGVSTSDIILKIKEASPEIINSEIIKLIEEGAVYEPRPGRLRYLG